MIPESYVPDLQLRMSLYRRLADLDDAEEIDAFGAELIDRFGPLPEEVEHLLKIVFVKALCRRANVEKLDAGPKGVVIAFRDNAVRRPGRPVRYIGEQGSLAKIRPDQSVVFIRDWERRATGSRGWRGYCSGWCGWRRRGRRRLSSATRVAAAGELLFPSTREVAPDGSQRSDRNGYFLLPAIMHPRPHPDV